MTNKLLGGGGIFVLVVGLALLLMPVGHVPLLDANRQVLVDSEAGGRCAGEVYVITRGNGSAEEMENCLADSKLPKTTDLTKVQGQFCTGVISKGAPISKIECLSIMGERQLWPTATGALTESWNKRFPYPGDVLSAARAVVGGDESRTGDRDENVPTDRPTRED